MRVCGAGGNRTLVQTSDKCAFYMLSLLLVFENNQGISTRVKPYFLNLTKVPELYFGQPEIVALHGRTGIRQIHPRNVPSPLPRAAIKPIYYNSIRQQERSYFRQLQSLRSDIYEPDTQCSTCLHINSSCCQKPRQPQNWHKARKFNWIKLVFSSKTYQLSLNW